MQIGKENFEKLQKSKVLLFGLGGVGGSVAETLTRSGIGSITIVDGDIVDITNLNRQIIATHSVVGKSKVEVCAKRLLDINPNLELVKYDFKFPSPNIDIDFSNFNYVVDAIDDFDAKILIIKTAKENNIPVISAMGAGNKFDPRLLRVDDISHSSVCPLARKVRQKLRELKIDNVKCVYSTEKPINLSNNIISSNAFVPATAGILIAREVVLELIRN